jgi:NAD(P)H-dependent FMN reductase
VTHDQSTIRVLVLIGSLRSGSLNRQLAHTAIASAPEHVEATLFDQLGELPHYNEDIDTATPPEAVQALRTAAADSAALLVVTPEYNGGLPGVIKNAFDWLSRPYGESALIGKPAAVIGTALGRYGAAWAHADARKTLAIAGAQVPDDIELSIPAKNFNGLHPQESEDVVASLRETWAQLIRHVQN